MLLEVGFPQRMTLRRLKQSRRLAWFQTALNFEKETNS